MSQKTYLTLDSINALITQIKKDIEAASANGGTSGAAYDDTLIKSRLTKLEKYMDYLNPWGEYEWITPEIKQPGISSEVIIKDTKFYEECMANEEKFYDDMEADKFELYILRQVDNPRGLNRYDTMLPREGSTVQKPGSELHKVCKYNEIEGWNWNYDSSDKLTLSTSGDSGYTFVMLKRRA
jgi:hypothetical protein